MHLIDNVQPIVPGFVARLRLAYPMEFVDAHGLATGELDVTFRHKASDRDALAVLSTDGGEVTRQSGDTELLIEVNLDASVTQVMQPDCDVQFSLVRIDDGGRTLIPGVWSWPVRQVPSRGVGR